MVVMVWAPLSSRGSRISALAWPVRVNRSQLKVTPLSAHPGFPGATWTYDPPADAWRSTGRMPRPTVTVPVVEWEGRYVIPSGELRPGVRTPEVWTRRPAQP